MNRMAILSSVAVAVLTLAAFVNHVQTSPLPEVDLPSMPPQEAGLLPAAAPPVEVPTQLPEAPPTVGVLSRAERSELLARLTRDIVQPWQESLLDHRRFSRVRLPARELSIRLEKRTVRPPREESGPVYAQFEVHEEGNRFSRAMRQRVLAHGRVEMISGRIELALPRATSQVRTWEPAATVLTRLGALPPKGK